MNVQEILTTAFHAVTICFTLVIAYCEITKILSLKKALQVSESYQLQLNLSNNIALVDHPVVSPNKNTYKEIDQEPILLPPVNEDKPIDLTEFRNLLKPIKFAKPQMDFTRMTLEQLRKECSQMGIKWRDAVTDIKTGRKRHLRKSEIVAALQQKLSA
ncbi:hypothetical protein [Iningainema tapete]|uniref:Uncharacterized protein n=1 Tax=Iningainema tapete BLCC-T55 TaxID=2748662 RepID=A0A8J6XCJ8_9CYAN|nr:hypothetical protein [Iningainema tapete]MBD2772509.1 hypothetical protein [Iningainema tapete BLCC-T55]